MSAFRLRDPEIGQPWGPSLSQRFKQLRALNEVFGDPTSTQPMEIAWKKGVRSLAIYLASRFAELQAREHWTPYLPKPRAFRRQPGRRADPVFVDYMITTVFLQGRAFERRITERLITAMADGVDHYVMRGRPPLQGSGPGVILGQVWGCHAEAVPFVPHGEVIARLFFDPLVQGERHWLASELLSSGTPDERPWVNVPVNNHGIAAGERTEDGVPIRGLTVRVVFDSSHQPTRVWYYSDPEDRTDPPTTGEERSLSIKNGLVSHTFANPCEPRDQVGIAFRW
ncbi:hypothetical protein [Cryptosporangium sp. NPDC051539]|uniref:hypothetical protein n=1 Tax=Cryptosporangium sp. NPDC051539 TaxID=3363962 RepID=UPI0037B348D8